MPTRVARYGHFFSKALNVFTLAPARSVGLFSDIPCATTRGGVKPRKGPSRMFHRVQRSRLLHRPCAGERPILIFVLLTTLWATAACPKPVSSTAKTVVVKVDPKRVTPFQRGVGLGLFATDPDYDYGHLLNEIVEHGATDVLVVVPWYQTHLGTHDIAPRAKFSPNDATVVRTLVQAKKRGLRATLLPIVRLKHRTPTEWRGKIRPDAGVEQWFGAYQRFILRMAKAAQKGEAQRFGVGSELLSLEREEKQWRTLIANVRTVFSGRLFYSANWDHFDPIRFWDALDEVGVTAYFELTRDLKRPTNAALAAAWSQHVRDLARLRMRTKKPMFISEVGYPSKITAARYPWDETREAKVDLALQAQLLTAYCDAFSNAAVIDGFYVWNWFGFGGPTDGSYTPRGKPGAAAMKECLERPSWRGMALRPPPQYYEREKAR